MRLQLRRDVGSLKKSDLFALLAPMALSAAVFLISWLVGIPLFARPDEKIRMQPAQKM